MKRPADNELLDCGERRRQGAIRHTASIGILTYRRPEALQRCLNAVLEGLNEPLPNPWAISEILVVDNDPDGSAREAVIDRVDVSPTPVPIRYVHEPIAGVATARNRALTEAKGDVLVFIDDDEIPNSGWPHGLLTVLDETKAAMVGAPVLTRFTTPPPRWIADGGFFDRDDPPHGSRQAWLRSGNLAIDLHQVHAAGLRFDPRFRQGEDSAFTRAARSAGLDLRWSSVGSITEFVGPERFSTHWRIRREYLSNRAWTRSSIDLADGTIGRLSTRLRAGIIAGVRLAQGTASVLAGLATGRTARRNRGLSTVAAGAGKLAEIALYRRN